MPADVLNSLRAEQKTSVAKAERRALAEAVDGASTAARDDRPGRSARRDRPGSGIGRRPSDPGLRRLWRWASGPAGAEPGLGDSGARAVRTAVLCAASPASLGLGALGRSGEARRDRRPGGALRQSAAAAGAPGGDAYRDLMGFLFSDG